MPFTCAICSLDIQIGEPMLSDEKMNLAHKACVDRLIKEPAHPSINIPQAQLDPSPPVLPIPCPPAPDTCVPSRAPDVCVECQKPAISMCPSCLKYVHQSFGYAGPACSLNHEARCAGARESRKPLTQIPVLKMSGPIFDTVEIKNKNSNGHHKKNRAKKARGRR
jgi:hypothetical protein